MRYVSKFLFLLLCLPFFGDAALFKASDNSKFAAVVKDIFWINDVKAAGPTQFDCKNPTDPGCGGSAFQPRDDELALEKGEAVIGGGSTGGNTTTTEPTTQTCEAEVINDNGVFRKCCKPQTSTCPAGLLTEEEKNVREAMYSTYTTMSMVNGSIQQVTKKQYVWYNCSESAEHSGCYECALNNCLNYLRNGNLHHQIAYTGNYNTSGTIAWRYLVNEDEAIANNYAGLLLHTKYKQEFTNETTGDKITCYYTCKRGDYIDSNYECDIEKTSAAEGRIYKKTDEKYYALKFNNVSGAVARLAGMWCGGSGLSYFGGNEDAGKWKIPTPGQLVDMANWYYYEASDNEKANVSELPSDILTYHTYGSSASDSGGEWNNCWLRGVAPYEENTSSLACTSTYTYISNGNSEPTCNTSNASTKEVKIFYHSIYTK